LKDITSIIQGLFIYREKKINPREIFMFTQLSHSDLCDNKPINYRGNLGLWKSSFRINGNIRRIEDDIL